MGQNELGLRQVVLTQSSWQIRGNHGEGQDMESLA